MKEFPLNLKPSLMAGLRKDVSARNSAGLVQSRFLHPRNGVLVPADDLTQPFEATVSWPFPQLFQGNGRMLLADETTLYEVSGVTLTLVNIYDLHNPMTEKDIPSSSEPWHFVDFFNTWMLIRPDCIVLRTNAAGMFGEEVVTYAQDNISINTGCAFKGRCLLGGFNPDDFWSDDWRSLAEEWTDRLAYAVDTTLSMGNNFVWWSSIGGGNVLDLFLAQRSVDGTFSEEDRNIQETTFLEAMQRNDFGFMPMPFRGDVLTLKPLGKGVVAYGVDGIAVMVPVIEPAPTFGCYKVSGTGLLSRGAVGGNDQQHVFISSEGDLCSLSADFQLSRLGYKEFFQGFSQAMISLDEQKEEYYIADGNTSYVLGTQGLGESSVIPTSAFRYNGAFIGVFSESAETEAIVVTDVIDFGIRDMKTITTVELGVTATTSVSVAVDYRYSKASAFARSVFVLVNDEGFARIQMTAVEFRVVVKFTVPTNVEFDALTIKWQLCGKRTTRGIYGS